MEEKSQDPRMLAEEAMDDLFHKEAKTENHQGESYESMCEGACYAQGGKSPFAKEGMKRADEE